MDQYVCSKKKMQTHKHYLSAHMGAELSQILLQYIATEQPTISVGYAYTENISIGTEDVEQPVTVDTAWIEVVDNHNRAWLSWSTMPRTHSCRWRL